MSTPQSVINICSGVRLDNRYEHTIFFENQSDQIGFFAGKVVKTFPAYSYLRKSWSLQVEATMEQARTWSYLYFRNGTEKYYFYFINQVEYKNDNMVELTIEMDVMQTYLFDMHRLPCFVERIHTPTDDPGDHTQAETLETGELVDNAVVNWSSLSNDLCILVMAGIHLDNKYDFSEDILNKISRGYGLYNGVFSGLKLYAIKSADWEAWGQLLQNLSDEGTIEGIFGMWMYPRELVKLKSGQEWYSGEMCKTVDGGVYNATFTPFATRPTSVDGYTPKNKKVLTYPYSFIYVSNNNGAAATYRWERFRDNTVPQFTAVSTVSPEAVVKIYPNAYNEISGNGENYEAGLTLGGFPACAWNVDTYKLWLAQNQNQHAFAETTAGLSAVGGTVAMIAGLATANPLLITGGLGTTIGGAQQIGSMLAQKEDMKIQPPQARGNFSSAVNITAEKQTFSFYQKSVSAENARVIDDYFTMYGYRVNRVEVPAIHNRSAFTYVKTVGCCIEGSMCTEDLNKIQSIFDRGVTFWVDGNRIGDYRQDNELIFEPV